jgi:hypothetical protein
VAGCHFFEGQVALALVRVPMEPFPIFAQYLAQSVAGRQCYTDAEAPLGCGDTRVNQIVLVAIVHRPTLFTADAQYTESQSNAIEYRDIELQD